MERMDKLLEIQILRQDFGPAHGTINFVFKLLGLGLLGRNSGPKMSSSKCKLCGEEIVKTAKYSVKIHPSKRIPKKAKKIINGQQNQDNSLFRLTKFQKYLQRCTQQRNFIEVTCGNCGEGCKISMKKPNPTLKSTSNSAKRMPTCTGTFNESLQGSIRKRKRKSTTYSKDLNAGLTIPPLFSTPKLASKRFEHHNIHNSPVSHNVNNAFNNKKESHKTELLPITVTRKHSFKDKKAIASQARVIEQKEMSKLKTALFKSNEDLKKPTPSLLNFFKN